MTTAAIIHLPISTAYMHQPHRIRSSPDNLKYSESIVSNFRTRYTTRSSSHIATVIICPWAGVVANIELDMVRTTNIIYGLNSELPQHDLQITLSIGADNMASSSLFQNYQLFIIHTLSELVWRWIEQNGSVVEAPRLDRLTNAKWAAEFTHRITIADTDAGLAWMTKILSHALTIPCWSMEDSMMHVWTASSDPSLSRQVYINNEVTAQDVLDMWEGWGNPIPRGNVPTPYTQFAGSTLEAKYLYGSSAERKGSYLFSGDVNDVVHGAFNLTEEAFSLKTTMIGTIGENVSSSVFSTLRIIDHDNIYIIADQLMSVGLPFAKYLRDIIKINGEISFYCNGIGTYDFPHQKLEELSEFPIYRNLPQHNADKALLIN